MNLRCKKCGAIFRKNHILEITDDPEGYRCKVCFTVHSWIDGSITKSEFNHKSILGSIIGKPKNRR